MKVKLTKQQFRRVILKEHEEKFESDLEQSIYFLENAEEGQLDTVSTMVSEMINEKELADLLDYYEEKNRKIYEALIENGVIRKIVQSLFNLTQIDRGRKIIDAPKISRHLVGLPFHRFKGWYKSMGRMEMYRLKMLDDFKNNIKEIYKYFFQPIMDPAIQNRVLKKYIDGLYKRLE